MKRCSGFCWCDHIPGRPLALYHVCDSTEKGRPRAHMCAPGMLSKEQRHKATGSIRAHPSHVDELERSSNTNSETGGLSQEEAQYSGSGKSQTFLSPPLTGWSSSSSQRHPSPSPSCPAPRTEGNRVPSLSAPRLSLCSWRKSRPLTLGERFREMVCPSLLRKEIGDLVLAIRTALSSAFRSEASAGRNWQRSRTAVKAPPRREGQGALNRARTPKKMHTEACTLGLLFSMHTNRTNTCPSQLQSQNPPLQLFKNCNLPVHVGHSRVPKPHFEDKKFRQRQNGRDVGKTRCNPGHLSGVCRHLY